MRRVRAMVLDILYYAKDRELDYEKLAVLEFASDLFNVVSHRAEELGIDFERDFDVSAGEFEADRAALRTALINILENAFDACRVDHRKKNHKVSFRVTSGPDDGVVFEIQDNGIGIDRETREKMFSLFFSSKGSEGTGLGLFIANKIAEAHGGKVTLESELGVGTRFSVMLPRSRGALGSGPH